MKQGFQGSDRISDQPLKVQHRYGHLLFQKSCWHCWQEKLETKRGVKFTPEQITKLQAEVAVKFN